MLVALDHSVKSQLSGLACLDIQGLRHQSEFLRWVLRSELEVLFHFVAFEWSHLSWVVRSYARCCIMLFRMSMGKKFLYFWAQTILVLKVSFFFLNFQNGSAVKSLIIFVCIFLPILCYFRLFLLEFGRCSNLVAATGQRFSGRHQRIRGISCHPADARQALEARQSTTVDVCARLYRASRAMHHTERKVGVRAHRLHF